MLLLTVGMGCSGSLPVPDTAIHPKDAYEPVPYPAPAALAETVSAPPRRSGAVWIDGEWVFQGRHFVWQRGGWVMPPKTAGGYAPSRATYLEDGRLMLAPGTWYDTSGSPLPQPDFVVPATTPSNEVTAESQSGR